MQIIVVLNNPTFKYRLTYPLLVIAILCLEYWKHAASYDGFTAAMSEICCFILSAEGNDRRALPFILS